MGRKKVLILVNEKQILEILTFAIGREGYETIRSLDGTDGIDLAASRKPDIIRPVRELEKYGRKM